MANNNLLLDGIIDEAQKKADAVLKDAQKQCGRIARDGQARAADLVAQEDREQKNRLSAVAYRRDAAKQSAKRKAALVRIDASYRAVMARVDEKFASLARSKAFRPTLVNWIAEAAVGLDLREAKVAFSPLCPVDEPMLREAEALVEKATGAAVRLSLDSKPLRSFGVVLSSPDGKISFNNEVAVRLRRYDSEIRTLVQEHTWKAE